MSVSGIALFDLADRRLEWADRRQGLLAQNIANADTPGWQAHEAAPFAASLAGAGGAAMTQTSAMHLAAAPGAVRGVVVAGPRSPDGNGVALDEQLAKVADTETIHDLAGDLYKKFLGFFKIAIGR